MKRVGIRMNSKHDLTNKDLIDIDLNNIKIKAEMYVMNKTQDRYDALIQAVELLKGTVDYISELEEAKFKIYNR